MSKTSSKGPTLMESKPKNQMVNWKILTQKLLQVATLIKSTLKKMASWLNLTKKILVAPCKDLIQQEKVKMSTGKKFTKRKKVNVTSMESTLKPHVANLKKSTQQNLQKAITPMRKSSLKKVATLTKLTKEIFKT